MYIVIINAKVECAPLLTDKVINTRSFYADLSIYPEEGGLIIEFIDNSDSTLNPP